MGVWAGKTPPRRCSPIPSRLGYGSISLIAQHYPLPRRTLERLRNPSPRGAGLHQEMLEVFFSIKASADEKGLVLTPEDFWDIARAKGGYAHLAGDDGEIQRAIDGLFAGAVSSPRPAYSLSASPAPKRKKLTETPEQIELWRKNASKFIESHGGKVEQIDLIGASPIQPSTGRVFLCACETLFKPDEGIAVVTKHNEEGTPFGCDEVKTTADWRAYFNSGKTIRCKAGGWWRVNPVNPSGGSGKFGTLKDCDIMDFRYMLLENDKISLDLQAGLLAYLPLPIVSIVDSAGKSLHALVRIDAPDKPSFKEKAEALTYDLHERFGFDPANTNPSRMSRLPDGWRDIKRRESSDGNQKILFLSERNREAKGIL